MVCYYLIFYPPDSSLYSYVDASRCTNDNSRVPGTSSIRTLGRTWMFPYTIHYLGICWNTREGFLERPGHLRTPRSSQVSCFQEIFCNSTVYFFFLNIFIIFLSSITFFFVEEARALILNNKDATKCAKRKICILNLFCEGIIKKNGWLWYS